MELIYRSQGKRKTTELISRVKETNGILIVLDSTVKNQLIKNNNLNEDSCYTIFEIKYGKHLGQIQRRPFFVDDADKVLQALLGIQIKGCTITKEDGIDL